MLFFLIAGHALCDYPLQGDAMAACKCRRSTHPAAASVPWYYWLTAHALIHGAAVGLVVRYWAGFDPATAAAYALAETVVHWLIDLGKCERLYGIHVDQGLHVGCKVAWWALLAAGVTASQW
jgi:hypothetical protein